ncbi:MFS general substrate transporter [Meira miltonrushii]|uniref:MFS general substrate transporter n=1 Tax=Meira miltonrushii TaxID=1280837 RepID=A0A316VHM8_9BASI|nr:MFS general substrate transporter [Meira miltonrushii]PWN36538.1 MFS general substrate transporter [Meira miltonrushii]
MRKASRKALLKTDFVIMPLMALVVMLQYLDKAIFSYAALLGLVTDLRITMGQYSFAASIYYIGMISGLPLWTFVLQRVSADLSTGATVTLWGMITMTHAATHNYSGILAVRFFLGFLESSVTPALVLITSMFYTPRETISRTAIWYAFNGVALILGGGLSYGLLSNPSVIKSSLAIWRQLYLILGGITIFVGLMLLAFMPNTPNRTRLYSPIERKAVLIKESNDESGVPVAHTPYVKKTRKIAWYQWIEAVCDVRLYLFFCGLLVGSIPNGGVTAYSTQLLSGFGFSQAETLLVSIAPGGGQIVSVLLFIITALLTKSRILGANLLLFIAIAGSTMMYVSTTGRTAKTVGYVLLNFGSPAVVALYSFIGSAVLGHDKRVIFTIVSQLAYALGNIIGPLVFLESETLLNYPTAKKVIIGSLAGAAFTLFCIGIIHAAWNYKRNLNRDDSELEQQTQGQTGQDLSDFKREDFRYVY